MITIGIDPGLTGAIAVVDGSRADIEDMPTLSLEGKSKTRRRIDGRGLRDLVLRHVTAGSAVIVVCEAVRIFGSSDRAGSTQTASLMRTLGAIEAVFDVLRWPCVMVQPQAWQKHFGLQGKGQEVRKPGQMPAAIVTAKELYPDVAHALSRVKDHNRAEALLMARYGLDTLS